MTTKRLEIVQVMRAFACISIFLYHLPVAWGGKRVIIRAFRLWCSLYSQDIFLWKEQEKAKSSISEKKSFALCHYIGCLRLHCF